jgi:endoglucanase
MFHRPLQNKPSAFPSKPGWGSATWILSWLCFAALAAANPSEMAATARLDIQASPSVGSLSQGSAATGGGSLARMAWLPVAEQPLTYVAHWPIRHWTWSRVALSFVPQSNGTVSVDLLGPWAQAQGTNVLARMEVLWDDVRATGAALENGSFESLADGAPLGWANPWGGDVVLLQNPPPPDGAHAVAAWHDRRLRQTLHVSAGVPVELSAWVRASEPDGFVDQPRILDPLSPAHRAARRFRRGVNFGNVFEAPAGQDWGGGPIESQDLDAVAREGYDHVRLPVRWNAHVGPAPAYAISNAFALQIDAVVDGLLGRGVGVLLNVHHFDEFFDDPAANADKLVAIWLQLADRYRTRSSLLAFEILNEPHGAATTETMNLLYAQLIPQLRAANPDRTLFVGPGAWNGIGELPSLRLPPDSNLVVAVHLYEPFLFTHQGASWTGPQDATVGLVYPGPPPQPIAPHPDAAATPWVVEWFDQYNSRPAASNPCGPAAFEPMLQSAAEWAAYYGRPVHVGEFGAYSTADPASRARYYADMRAAMDRLGFGWAAWDWKAGFRYWDRDANAPAPGMRAALFPRPFLRPSADASHLSAAIDPGTPVALERTESLQPPLWTPIDSQTAAPEGATFPIPTNAPSQFFRFRLNNPN